MFSSLHSAQAIIYAATLWEERRGNGKKALPSLHQASNIPSIQQYIWFLDLFLKRGNGSLSQGCLSPSLFSRSCQWDFLKEQGPSLGENVPSVIWWCWKSKYNNTVSVFNWKLKCSSSLHLPWTWLFIPSLLQALAEVSGHWTHTRAAVLWLCSKGLLQNSAQKGWPLWSRETAGIPSETLTEMFCKYASKNCTQQNPRRYSSPPLPLNLWAEIFVSISPVLTRALSPWYQNKW